MFARRQYFNFRHTVEQVVVRLAHHRPGHAELTCNPHQLGNAPAAKIRHTPVPDFAGAQHDIKCAQRLFKGHAVVIAVQVQHVNIVGLQSLQTRIDFTQHPAA